MGKKITRRSFIRKGAVLGASSLFLTKFPERIRPETVLNIPDISVVTGTDYYKNTIYFLRKKLNNMDPDEDT